jgi:hypothetical protein
MDVEEREVLVVDQPFKGKRGALELFRSDLQEVEEPPVRRHHEPALPIDHEGPIGMVSSEDQGQTRQP